MQRLSSYNAYVPVFPITEAHHVDLSLFVQVPEVSIVGYCIALEIYTRFLDATCV